MNNTPGPWNAIEDGDGSGAFLIWAGYDFAVVDGVRFIADTGEPIFGDRERLEANARLIAAAPDLFAALERMVFVCSGLGWHRHPYDAIEEAERAIAKARND